MKTITKLSLSIAVALSCSQSFAADTITEAFTSGKVTGDFRLRYEHVDQDNDLKDADLLMLRSRLGYTTGSFEGFSATVEFEDARTVASVDDYNAAGLNGKPEYSVIADPETTEVDQMFLQYKNASFTTKLGRQVITMDNHRFVGHVGWRNDRQTFDAITASYSPMENLSLKYGYIDQRNRIFAEDRDIDSKDHILNASYKTSIGTVTGYGYLLEEDTDVDNGLDTWGVRFAGNTMFGDTKVIYQAEWATQESENADVEYDADYILIEGGAVFSGITVKAGYELLGSDDGMFGFSTPLATLHKFNGWSDQFLSTPKEGLADMYLSAGGKLFGGSWGITYHDFEADESSDTVDDLGDEIDMVYTMKFGKNYSAGLKYAMYSKGDDGAGKADTDKVWAWVGATF